MEDIPAIDEGPVPELEARLIGVTLTTPNVHPLADFYTDAIGYTGVWSGSMWRGTLAARWLQIGEGEKNALDHTAFAVADERRLTDLRARLDAANVPFEELAADGMRGDALRFDDPDGNAVVFGISELAVDGVTDDPATPRLQHIVFGSDEVNRLLDFYWHVVGFSPSDYVRDGSGDLASVFLRCSEEHHSLAIFRASRKRLDHLCYDIDDWSHIRDWADRFAERHIPLRWGPGRHGPGNNLFLFINDPDGNWLEFSAELERVTGARAIKNWAHEERTLNSWGSAFMRS